MIKNYLIYLFYKLITMFNKIYVCKIDFFDIKSYDFILNRELEDVFVETYKKWLIRNYKVNVEYIAEDNVIIYNIKVKVIQRKGAVIRIKERTISPIKVVGCRKEKIEYIPALAYNGKTHSCNYIVMSSFIEYLSKRKNNNENS